MYRHMIRWDILIYQYVPHILVSYQTGLYCSYWAVRCGTANLAWLRIMIVGIYLQNWQCRHHINVSHFFVIAAFFEGWPFVILFHWLVKNFLTCYVVSCANKFNAFMVAAYIVGLIWRHGCMFFLSFLVLRRYEYCLYITLQFAETRSYLNEHLTKFHQWYCRFHLSHPVHSLNAK